MGKIGKEFERELEIDRILEEVKEEYIKQAIRLFNDAYMLGQKHAKELYSKGANHE